jgi:hypothetical protein
MALRPSKALRNYLMEGGSLKHALSNCVLKVYTGAQPASAELAPTGTLLVTYSDNGGALTREVRATGTVTFTGSSGSVDGITVDGYEIMSGAEAFDTDLATTVANVAENINNNPKNQLFVASSSAGVLTLTAKYGLGTLVNGFVVVSSTTTMGSTDVNIGSAVAGVNAANGLLWGDADANVLVKDPDQTWRGTAVAGGTAGWFRFESAVTDPGTLDSSEAIIRLDGAVATSGAELTMNPTLIALDAVQTISSFSITFPTA